MLKQVKIYDKENDVFHGGILLEDGGVICACCGGLLEKDNIGPENNKGYQIVNIYENWVDFSKEIIDE